MHASLDKNDENFQNLVKATFGAKGQKTSYKLYQVNKV